MIKFIRKYFDKYKRMIIIHCANLDILPETRNVRRRIRQYEINKCREISLEN